MSSNFGAVSPLMDRIQRLRQMGSQAVNAIEHPIDTANHMFGPEAQHQKSHQDAIDEMNRQENMHNNDPANKSFQPLSNMKKPLGK